MKASIVELHVASCYHAFFFFSFLIAFAVFWLGRLTIFLRCKNHLRLHRDVVLGEGAFRHAYAGTYIGGNRNNQEAVCKCFKHQYRALESEFFSSDFECADKAIQYAEDWNSVCANGKEILVTRGDVHTIGGRKYLVEPLIRNFTKFTSNNGWYVSCVNICFIFA